MSGLGGTTGAVLSLEGGDPQEDILPPANTPPKSGHRNMHDTSVTIEEYMHYASITRAEPIEGVPHSFNIFKRKNTTGGEKQVIVAGSANSTSPTSKLSVSSLDDKTAHEKGGAVLQTGPSIGTGVIAADEWETASRAARTASWTSVFYLITTDILGPFSAPWAISQMGYGLGTALFVVFGAFAGYGGYLLWRMFLGLDSHKYPLKTYGDIAFRVYGTPARHFTNILQSIQLLFNVGIIVLSNGQSLSQMDEGKLCFIAGAFIFAVAGGIAGQIRTLRNLGWLANFAIWLNLFIIIATMAIVAHSPPNYIAALASYGTPKGPIVKTAGPPDGIGFSGQVVGLMQAVFSYGGAMLFVEFMAEMRRPFDFWKGMLCAQVFIFSVYVFFGLFVYSFQGQFTFNPAYQGISSYAWQTTANAFGIVSGLIAALLYGNIGIKVIYSNVGIDLFKLPPLETPRGKWLWIFIVPAYWAIAFVIGGAIPQISNLNAILAALCILQFSYTFPPWLMIGYTVQKDSMLDGDGFDPITGNTMRADSGVKRWIRGYQKRWLFNTFNTIFMLGSAVTAVLGIYSAVTGMIASYKIGSLVSFSCCSPTTGCT